MNDNLNDNVPADVQEQAFVTVKDDQGNEIKVPVEGEVTSVQDTEFSTDPAGN